MRLLSLLGAAGLAVLAVQTAQADQRYATPPPLVLSPDLSSPWTLQLRPMRQAAPVRVQRSRPTISRRAKASGSVQTASVTTARAGTTRLRRTIEADVNPELLPTMVSWQGSERAGTLIVNTIERRLYLVMPDGRARRYAVGVGKPGFEWAGTHKVSRKTEWPSWRPPAEMIERERAKGRELPAFMEGGPDNPMGARALYLGSSLYRIHGTNQAWSIGKAVSSGCIRMRNEDVMDLYDRVPVGARVRVI